MGGGRKLEITNRESNQQIFKDITSNLVSSLSSNMFIYGLGLMLLNQTHSALSFGIDLVVGPIISLICMVPIGNLVDKYPHKNIILISMIIRIIAILFLGMTIDIFKGLFKFIPVIVFVSINSAVVVFATTAYAAAVHELVNEAKIQQLSSLTSAATSFANIFAPVLGVGVYAVLGFQVFVWIEILALLFTSLLTLTMKFHYQDRPAQDIAVKTQSQFTNFKKGLNYIVQQPLIKRLVIIAVVLNFMFSSINMGLPYIINTQLHLGNTLIGILDMFNAIGGLLAGILLNFLSANRGKKARIIIPLFICGFYFLSLGLIFMQITKITMIIVWGSVTMLIGGLGVSVLNITTQVYIQKTTPIDILGRVMSTMTTASTIMFPVGTLFFTFLFQASSNGAVIYLICGVIWLIMLTIVMPNLSKNIK